MKIEDHGALLHEARPQRKNFSEQSVRCSEQHEKIARSSGGGAKSRDLSLPINPLIEGLQIFFSSGFGMEGLAAVARFSVVDLKIESLPSELSYFGKSTFFWAFIRDESDHI